MHSSAPFDLVGYVSGPYTKGDTALNVADAMKAGAELMKMGVAVIVPHLSHFLHMAHPFRYETWIAMDLVLLERCDFILRLPGISNGAELECMHAESADIPVFYNLPAVAQFIYKRRSICHTTKAPSAAE